MIFSLLKVIGIAAFFKRTPSAPRQLDHAARWIE